MKFTIRPLFDANNGRKISSLRVNCGELSNKVKKLLQGGAEVDIQLPNPFLLVLDIGRGQFREELELPMPLSGDRGKGRISRNSYWMDYTAPVAELNTLTKRPDMVFPLGLTSTGITLDNLHYISPDVLPILDIEINKNVSWLVFHTTPKSTMSGSEYAEFEKTDIMSQSARVRFKHSLSDIIWHCTGFQDSRKSMVFSITKSIYLLVTAVRMDISNQTFFLDAAVVPFADEIPTRNSQSRRDIIAITGSDSALKVWRHVLPAFAERCREWKHKSTCEYQTHGKVPLSTGPGERFMCDCGLGVFPTHYFRNLKGWQDIAKSATRVAIPICFASPINQDSRIGIGPTSVADRFAGLTVNDIEVIKGTCFTCGAESKSDGKALMKCAACKVAEYCSAECQKADWKAHKGICKQLEELNGQV